VKKRLARALMALVSDFVGDGDSSGILRCPDASADYPPWEILLTLGWCFPLWPELWAKKWIGRMGADVRFVAVSRHVQRALEDVDSCELLDWTHFDLCDSPYSVASVE
jgi:hypothetical protein